MILKIEVGRLYIKNTTFTKIPNTEKQKEVPMNSEETYKKLDKNIKERVILRGVNNNGNYYDRRGKEERRRDKGDSLGRVNEETRGRVPKVDGRDGKRNSRGTTDTKFQLHSEEGLSKGEHNNDNINAEGKEN